MRETAIAKHGKNSDTKKLGAPFLGEMTQQGATSFHQKVKQKAIINGKEVAQVWKTKKDTITEKQPNKFQLSLQGKMESRQKLATYLLGGEVLNEQKIKNFWWKKMFWRLRSHETQKFSGRKTALKNCWRTFSRKDWELHVESKLT